MQASTPVVTTNRRRTITLTNQAPIRIVEDEWPVIAQGAHGADLSSEPFGSEIAIRVRRENKPPGRSSSTPRIAVATRLTTSAPRLCALDACWTHMTQGSIWKLIFLLSDRSCASASMTRMRAET